MQNPSTFLVLSHPLDYPQSTVGEDQRKVSGGPLRGMPRPDAYVVRDGSRIGEGPNAVSTVEVELTCCPPLLPRSGMRAETMGDAADE